ncbi:MAG: hypothetical protein WD966_03275 [Nitrosopumilaceae archaeon]
MALKAAIIITAISIALLLIYGVDVAVGGGTEQGFLPFDQKARGVGLGISGAALPIIGYFISRKESSKTLGVMIIISGLLIVIGSATFLAISGSLTKDDGMERNAIANFGPVIAVGAFIIALGTIKIKKSPKTSLNQNANL